ncbi:MAG TPA: DUF3482 domain-containing protein, partial [Ramlibacter sp.]
VQAIDPVDTQGRLVGAAERERLEQDALAATGDPAPGQAADPRAWLLARADRLLDLVSHRQPRLAALAQQPAWQHWAGWLLPLLALVLGGFIDRIDNPKQVNLLSPPLLAFVVWNLAVYLVLVVMAFWPHRAPRPPSSSWFSQLLERRTGGLRGDVAKAFGLAWFRHAGALEGQRWRRIMHTCAAAWAIGVALSIIAGGLVREYRVGWESTLLDLPQVHALLRALFAPVVALLPIEPVSQAELARLHFGSGVDVGRLEARRWVGLYVALLGVLVVLPRTLLALWAAFRQYRLSRAIAIDLRTPDFVALLGKIRPARVRLGVHVLPGADAHVLQLVLSQAGAQANPHPPAGRWTVLDTPRGDVLVCEPWLPAGATPSGVQGWLARFRGRPDPMASTEAPDIVLVLGDATALAAAVSPLKAAGTPVLWMPPARGAEGPATALRGAGLRVAIVPLTDLPTWLQDGQLRSTVGPLLPRHMAPGWQRLSALWSQHADARLARAMQALAEELLACARDTQPLEVQPLGVRQLVVRGERDASDAARQAAIAALVARVRERQNASDRHLLALHGVDAGQVAVDHALPGDVRVHHAVDEAQSGLAGAASGAAMGAAVDLMTGGLTLGAASALGALVGGGAALVAAAWKNRAGQPGASLVMLDDRVLLGLLDLALLRYLRVAHAGRGVASDAGWQDAVRSLTEAQRSELRDLLGQARSTKEGDGAAGTKLADALGRLAQQALERLHGRRS